MLSNRRHFFVTALRALGAYGGFAAASSCTRDFAPPAVAVRSPVPGSAWCPGRVLELAWVANAPFGLRLEWAAQGSDQWTILAELPAAAPSRWAWTLPTTLPARWQLRWREATTGQVLALVEQLALQPPQLRWVNAPREQDLLSGQTVSLQWAATCVERVDLAVSFNNGISWEDIATALVAEEGRYAWTVPARFTQQGKLRLRDRAAPNLEVISAGFFQITPEFVLNLSDFPALARVGGQAELEIPVLGAIAITRTAPTTFLVLQLTCTHLGCQVQAVPGTLEWRCPCHGSRFAGTGCALNGPALLPLPLVEHDWDPATNQLRLRTRTLPNPHC